MFDQLLSAAAEQATVQAALRRDGAWQRLSAEIDAADEVILVTPDGMQRQARVRILQHILDHPKIKILIWQPVSRKSLGKPVKSVSIDADRFLLFQNLNRLISTFADVKSPLSYPSWLILDRVASRQKKPRQADGYQMSALLERADGYTVKAVLESIHGKPAVVPDLNHVKALVLDLKEHEVTLQECRTERRHLSPPLPLDTAALIETAWNRFEYEPRDTLDILHSLQEGVHAGLKYPLGLVSQVFSSSRAVPDGVRLSAREFILNNYGVNYVPRSTYAIASDDAVALLPTTLRPPKKLKKHLSLDQLNIYTVIWEHFIAAHMQAAEKDIRQVTLQAGPNSRYLFRLEQCHYLSRGFLQFFPDIVTARSETDWMEWPPQSRLKLLDVQYQKPPAPLNAFVQSPLHHLVNEEELPAEMVVQGLLELLNQDLLHRDGRDLELTSRGRKTYNTGKAKLAAMLNPGFVQQVNRLSTLIGRGKLKLHQACADVESYFVQAEKQPSLPAVDGICPVCHGRLVQTFGKGPQIQCEHFPDTCHYRQTSAAPAQEAVRHCPDCGGVLKERSGPFGRFLACSNFPRCKHTEPFSTQVRCPKSGCDGHVIERQTKNGAPFFGCSRYPNCKFSSWQKPVNIACPTCGNAYLVEHDQYLGTPFQCPACKKHYDPSLNPVVQQSRAANE